MRRALVLGFLLACSSDAYDARIDAFGFARQGRLDLAAARLNRCAHIAEDKERWHCSALIGDIRARQSLWFEASIAYRESFSIRDRIAAREDYGSPSEQDLYLRIGKKLEAKPILERALKSASIGSETQLHTAAIDLALVEVEPDPYVRQGYELYAATRACHTEEIKYFQRSDADLHQRYLPSAVLIELGDACKTSGGNPEPLYRYALDQAEAHNDAPNSAAARKRIP
jgi:hypothetical protein